MVEVPPDDESTIVIALRGTITRDDVPGLCDRLYLRLVNHPTSAVVCDVGALDRPDAVLIDALARLQLTARRMGATFRLRHADDALLDLLALTGLDEIVQD